MKTKYFKNGNPELYNFFTDAELKQFTPKEKAMWTPFSEAELAPIPEEVIQFNEEQKEPCCKEDDKCKKLEAELDKANETNKELVKLIKHLRGELKEAAGTITEEVIIPEEEKETEKELDEDAAKKLLIEELKKKGIKANMNYKLETLQKKLADANNSE